MEIESIISILTVSCSTSSCCFVSRYLDSIPVREPLNVRKLFEFLASTKDFTPIELQFIGTNPNRMPNDGPFLPTVGLNRFGKW